METATSQSAIKQDQSSAITIVFKLFRKISFIFTFFSFFKKLFKTPEELEIALKLAKKT